MTIIKSGIEVLYPSVVRALVCYVPASVNYPGNRRTDSGAGCHALSGTWDRNTSVSKHCLRLQRTSSLYNWTMLPAYILAQVSPDYSAHLTKIADALSQKPFIPTWATPIIGAAVGFLFGILADPIKNWMERTLGARKMRHDLYTFTALGYKAIRALDLNLKDTQIQEICRGTFEDAMQLVDLEKFDAITEDKNLFHSLDEYTAFKRFATILKTMQTSGVALTCEQIRAYVKEFKHEFDRYSDAEVIHRDTIERAGRKWVENNMREADKLVKKRGMDR